MDRDLRVLHAQAFKDLTGLGEDGLAIIRSDADSKG